MHLPRRTGSGSFAMAFGVLAAAVPVAAQALDPRAYVRAPINSTVATTGFSVSHGSVLTDGALQAHVSYSFTPRAWAAFDATSYRGGQATVNGVPEGNRLISSRVGLTAGLPVGKRHAVKIAYSTGAIVRFGANFDTFSIGWQTVWIDRRMLKR